MNKEKRPRVGVGVLVFKDGQVLLGKRRNAHGAEEYAGVGGHLEYLESFEDCARREAMEEAGIEIENITFLQVMNMTAYAPAHYVDVGLRAELKSGTPKVLEPNKCENWEWFDLDKLPENLFASVQKYIESCRTGSVYYDDRNENIGLASCSC